MHVYLCGHGALHAVWVDGHVRERLLHAVETKDLRTLLEQSAPAHAAIQNHQKLENVSEERTVTSETAKKRVCV
jgi:hypothetical protein